MQIAMHIGAHATEEDRLMKSLVRNNGAYYQKGIFIPGPRKYRKLLSQVVDIISQSQDAAEAHEIFFDSFVDQENLQRIVMSHSHLLGRSNAVIEEGVLYPLAEQRMARLNRLFEQDDLHVFLGIRNPATHIPEVFQLSSAENIFEFIGTEEPLEIRWSDTIKRIQSALTDVPITVWCYEDLPLLWEEILRLMIGSAENDKIDGAYDLLVDLLNKEGLVRLNQYLEKFPDVVGAEKRNHLSRVLESYVIEDEMEQELNIPQWNAEMVDDLTYGYEYDLKEIKNIPNVTLLEI